VRRLLDTGASVENGGSCGWQPLNLALTGGDANIEVRVRVRVRVRVLP